MDNEKYIMKECKHHGLTEYVYVNSEQRYRCVKCRCEAVQRRRDKIKEILESLNDSEKYGMVLRAKGIVDSSDSNGWIHFDYVPGECDVRRGSAAVIGRICIIGSGIDEQAIRELFGI